MADLTHDNENNCAVKYKIYTPRQFAQTTLNPVIRFHETRRADVKPLLSST